MQKSFNEKQKGTESALALCVRRRERATLLSFFHEIFFVAKFKLFFYAFQTLKLRVPIIFKLNFSNLKQRV